MRQFEDQDGRGWSARVAERPGDDYKGRFHLVMEPQDGTGQAVDLVDVCWNGRRVAQRALDTMSIVELRRRLRSARGRSASPVPTV